MPRRTLYAPEEASGVPTDVEEQEATAAPENGSAGVEEGTDGFSVVVILGARVQGRGGVQS